MQHFDKLSNRGQQQRLRALAKLALREYPLAEYTMHALLHRENTTFKIVTPSPSARFVLRISKPTVTLQSVRSEAIWLKSITDNTDLIVPDPVPTHNGALVTQVQQDAIPQPRICCLFRWVPGRFRRSQNFSRTTIQKVGRFMGHLHRHAQHFVPPTGFTRPLLDYEGILGKAHGGNLADLKKAVSAPNRHLIDQTAAKIKAVMQTLGQHSSLFGLIHADFHPQNYLFQRGQVHGIDFDACSFGHYLADIAATTRMLRHPSIASNEVLAHFLVGYRSVRDFTGDMENHIDLFKAANSLMLAIWMTSRLDNPLLRSQSKEFIEFQLEQIKHHIE